MSTINPLEWGIENPKSEPREGRGLRERVSKKKGKYKDSEFLEYLRSPKSNRREVHSSFFLSIGGVVEAAYECPKCGFHGFFESEVCAKCGERLE